MSHPGPRLDPHLDTYARPGRGDSAFAHVLALIVGVPTMLITFPLAMLGGGLLAPVLFVPATIGVYLAITGMWARPRRHRVAALTLTVIPGLLLVVAGGALMLFVLVFLGGGNPNS